MSATEAKQWAAPKMELIGKIGDVAGSNLSSNNQLTNTCGTNGNGTCKS
jgi:hypothetical protein